ncbi:hypothetical protein Hydth_1434 [Hydrogenobacter thermophilus TK-6]|uniref:Uncharacterized protein n=1 Tax=Hydrogenobacter thermophilus (strain DSM 6534 / IAM 12695 / TK-6) TaxID=608538 RepID=D3DJ94_HYDTT|nr:hypothetical protein [Hydrogenobacter thermophilus]ADO45819.1 hypothetical protein Hydth_1434 [Hydrogenobacter thermophilus TK-6]BAI69896.1 hypothetical protein HTH_1446 [Hydrogenobacter thermophilus TK-6]
MRKALIALLSIIGFGYSIDELYIRVRVESYEPKTGTLKVIGTSGACRGYKMNLISKPGSSQYQSLINREIYVLIDSSICQDGGTYRIKEER